VTELLGKLGELHLQAILDRLGWFGIIPMGNYNSLPSGNASCCIFYFLVLLAGDQQQQDDQGLENLDRF
jgi:hypothetical protein